MTLFGPRKLPFLFALAASAVALPASADSPSLRRAGDAVDSETRSFSFHNEIGLGLMRLSFVFDSGEYGLSRLGHMVGIGASHNWFSTDSLAEYQYDVKHYPLAGQVYTAHELECTGPCGLGIDPPPADHMLVLSGFNFEATDGVPSSIKTIAIEPDPDNGVIWVELDDGDDDAELLYGATVQYSYIPTQDVVNGTMLSGTKTSSNEWRVQFKWNELAGTTSPLLLHGFRLEFTDGPHPLNRLQLLMTGNKATMYFTDAGFDESFTGSIDVVPTTY